MTRRYTTVAVLVGASLTAVACAPGGGSGGEESTTSKAASEVETDPAAMGDITLTVWDQEVRGGQDKQMKALNAAFEKKYPNITIKRVSRSFDDLTKTLRLALTGDDAPDVVQANNTRSQMGQFVKAKQIINLDPYAEAYGWRDRYPESVQSVVSYSPDAKTFGEGSIFGLPQVGEVVGIFYDKKMMEDLGIEQPKTWAQFEEALATAKEAGETPLVLGNIEKWPAVHVFGALQGRYTDAETIRTLGYGRPGASWTDEGNEQTGATLVDWVDKGYFNEGFNGEGYDAAWQSFSKGDGLFLIAGSWLQSDLYAAMKDDVGFMLPPVEKEGDTPVTTGGSGLPFAVTSKAENPDAAAAYIDFITNDDAMDVLAENGNMPVVGTAERKAADPLGDEIFAAFGEVSEKDGLTPYLDWATPTMGDTMGAGLQDMLAGKKDPKAAMETIEADYAEFTKE